MTGKSLSQLAGERMRQDVQVAESPTSYALARRRFVERAAARTPGFRPSPWLAAAAVVAVAGVLLWLAVGRAHVTPMGERDLTFVAGDAPERGRVGAYYAAHKTPLPLSFADGSRIQLAEKAGLRVSKVQERAVAVQLETGSASFDIVPATGMTWEVMAGPYSVRVTGTAFRLSWDVPLQQVELEMRSGSVVVSGPGIEAGQRVSGTERFSARVVASRASGANGDAAVAIPTGAAPDAPVPNTETSAISSSSASAPAWVKPPIAPSSPGPVASSADSPAAPVAGISSASAKAPSVEQLLAQADAERLAGRSADAERTLRSVRARFPGSPGAANAAFLLGKSAEAAGDTTRALSLYDTHLRESGSLAAEALGRKMLILYRLGNAECQATSRQYLKQFPSGPYARQAREILDE